MLEVQLFQPRTLKKARHPQRSRSRLLLNTAVWSASSKGVHVNSSIFCRQSTENLYNLQMWRFIFCIFASKLDWGSSTSTDTPIPIVLICHELCNLTRLSLVLPFKLLFSSPSSCLIIFSFFLYNISYFSDFPFLSFAEMLLE